MRTVIREMLAPLRRAKTALLRRAGVLNGSWSEGLPVEATFWRNALREPAKYWFVSEYEFRTNPEAELQPELRALLAAPEGATVRILDVGAGPLTTLGKRWPGRTVEITAVDPLAAEYDTILAECALVPPVRTTVAEGETLDAKFPADSFDLAYSSNALDHSRDPVCAIRQMLRVVKPGGHVYLWHFANEGLAEKYHGLHQWNFDAKGGDFLISDGHRPTSLSRELGAAASISTEETVAFGKRVVIGILHKPPAA